MKEIYKKLFKKYRKEIFTSVLLLISISILSILGPFILKELMEDQIETGLKVMEPTYLTERVNGTINTIFSLYSSSISGIFVSALTAGMILWMILRINWMLALLYFLQIPIQYFGFQKLLNGEKSKLSEYGILLQETGRACGCEPLE